MMEVTSDYWHWLTLTTVDNAMQSTIVQIIIFLLVTALKLKLIGKGEAHWSKQKGKRTKYYDAEEFYINHEKILIEEGNKC